VLPAFQQCTGTSTCCSLPSAVLLQAAVLAAAQALHRWSYSVQGPGVAPSLCLMLCVLRLCGFSHCVIRLQHSCTDCEQVQSCNVSRLPLHVCGRLLVGSMAGVWLVKVWLVKVRACAASAGQFTEQWPGDGTVHAMGIVRSCYEFSPCSCDYCDWHQCGGAVINGSEVSPMEIGYRRVLAVICNSGSLSLKGCQL
jgi:hypothetical protein